MITEFDEEIQRLMEKHIAIRADERTILPPDVIASGLWTEAMKGWNAHFSKNLSDFCWITPYEDNKFIIKFGAVRIIYTKGEESISKFTIVVNADRTLYAGAGDLKRVYQFLGISEPLAETAWMAKDDDVRQVDNLKELMDLGALWGVFSVEKANKMPYPLLAVKTASFEDDFVKLFPFPKLIERKEQQ